MKKKLADPRKLQVDFSLIDLGLEYFTVKFSDEISQKKVIQEGPWFLDGSSYPSIRVWELNFVPKESQFETTAIWVRLPQLPTEFYDASLLQRVGRKIGRLLKVNVCTSATLRGRYAWICVQVPMDTPLKSLMTIGTYKQQIHYERKGFLCKRYEKLGYSKEHCAIFQAT